MYGISSGAALTLEAAAAGVPMCKLAAYEAPYTAVGVVNGVPVDHERHLNELLAKNKRGAMVSYFLMKMVGAPAFVPLMRHFIPGVWKSQTTSANSQSLHRTLDGQTHQVASAAMALQLRAFFAA
jgi:hypothetical protein